ncbi:MAG: hypothetical protein P1U85_08250 [Verrucomicrobiales bacterium]|jgi:translation initiation factor IF-1|nr:hypothetical protein [Verrucomicrobiales bacterium]
MPERPPIRATGRITRIHEPARLYEVEMENGYRAYAILEKKGPRPVGEEIDRQVLVDFSPFDMSRCRIVSWEVEEASVTR